MNKSCVVCGLTFLKTTKEGFEDWALRKFCSHACAYVGRKTNKGRKFPDAGPKIAITARGNKKWLGKKHTDAAKLKMSIARKGMFAGEKHPNWKGGISPEHHLIRTSVEYSLWRKAVFDRDGYACVLCGDSSGNNLNADHIKPFAHFPESRFDVNNGRTLCVSCHRKTDTYGGSRRYA